MAEQLKVILWCCPRTMSTAFLKCMSAVPDSQMIFELYTSSLVLGPDRLDTSIPALQADFSEETLEEFRQNPGSGYPTSIATNEWVKHLLENGYRDKEMVFAKEMASSLLGQYHLLPESGFRHAFLMREPIKVFKSWKQTYVDLKKGSQVEELELDKMSEGYMPPGRGFKELYDLYHHVKENGLDPDPVIIDADDILRDPAATLSAFCKKLGIRYSNSMLTWEAGLDVVQKWTVNRTVKSIIENKESFKNFRESTGFKRPKVQNVLDVSSDTPLDVSPDIQRLVDFSMPYYTKMYQLRLTTF